MAEDHDPPVRLLGRPRIRTGATWVDFAPEKRYRLLAYLAYQGEWTSRERLADLFWPNRDSRTARRNLRALAARARALPWSGGLEADRHALRWRVATDVAAFEAHAAKGRTAAALDWHGGQFLEGLDGFDDDRFAEWLELERAHREGRRRALAVRLAAELEEANRPGDAARALLPLLDDPLDEEALQLYMHSAARAGDGGAALRAFRTFEQRLERELKMEPSAVSRQLAAAVRDGGDVRALRSGASRLPTTGVSRVSPTAAGGARPAHGWVGRDHELAAIGALLARPECRMLTIVGPGGVGKSRLAAEVATRLAPGFAGGAVVVALGDTDSPADVAGRLASALGLELRGPTDGLQQVAHRIGAGHALVVLDDVDGILPGVDELAALLDTCPNLHLLLTSRERADVPAEWLFPLHGLAFPSARSCAADEALAFDAVGLFVARAQRVQPAFALRATDVPAVLDICRSVDGFPLGLELAAAWVRVVSCERIAQEIHASLDFLAASRPMRPGRHASLRATFEWSWRLLGTHEQAALRDLAVFRGGFSPEAAAAVSGSSLTALTALVDKSLLSRDGQNRYRFHPLVFAYADEKAQARAGRYDELRRRHARFYLQALQRELDHAGTVRGTALAGDGENVRAAWRHVTRSDSAEAVLAAVEPVVAYVEAHARYREGLDLLAGLPRDADPIEGDRLRARGGLLAGMAGLLRRVGRPEDAERHAVDALAALGPGPADAWAVIRAHETLGYTASFNGRTVEAVRHWGAALEAARRHRRAARELEIGGLLGWAEAVTGHQASGERRARALLDAIATIDDPPSVVACLTSVGSIYLATGKPRLAHQVFGRALDMARAHEETRSVPHLLFALAEAAFELGDQQRVVELCDEAATLAERHGDQLTMSWALALSGRAAGVLGDDARCEQRLVDAAERAWRLRNATAALTAAAYLGEATMRRGDADRAVAILHLVARHPATAPSLRPVVSRLLAENAVDPAGPRVPAGPGDAAPGEPGLTLEAVMELVFARA